MAAQANFMDNCKTQVAKHQRRRTEYNNDTTTAGQIFDAPLEYQTTNQASTSQLEPTNSAQDHVRTKGSRKSTGNDAVRRSVDKSQKSRASRRSIRSVHSFNRSSKRSSMVDMYVVGGSLNTGDGDLSTDKNRRKFVDQNSARRNMEVTI